jgi:hypothetical protein
LQSSTDGDPTRAIKRPRDAGRPSKLEQDPTLASRIIKLLDAGLSMQQAADQLKIGIRTLRDWARAGEKVDHGPLHDIALAVERSKNNRGFGTEKHARSSSSPGAESQTGVRVVPVVGTEEEWNYLGHDVNSRNTLELRTISGKYIQIGMEVKQILGRSNKTVEPVRPKSETVQPSNDLPEPGHYQVVSAALQRRSGWEYFPCTPKEFEALYQLCDSASNPSGGEFLPWERRWPRDSGSLTPEQRDLLSASAQFLVRDSKGAALRVQFKWGQV